MHKVARASAEDRSWSLDASTTPGRSGCRSGLQHCAMQLAQVEAWPAGLQVYKEPTVLLAKRVSGEEEVPEGVVAVLTPDAPDVLSHVSVRARNMKVGDSADLLPMTVIMVLQISVMQRQQCPQQRLIHPLSSTTAIQAGCKVHFHVLIGSLQFGGWDA